MYLTNHLKQIGDIIWKHKRHTLEVTLLSGIGYLFLEGVITLNSPFCCFDIYWMNVKGMTEKLPNIMQISAMYHISFEGVKSLLELESKYSQIRNTDVIDGEYEIILSN